VQLLLDIAKSLFNYLKSNLEVRALQKLLPALFNEMAHDLQAPGNKLKREFLLIRRRGAVYNGDPVLAYYYSDYEDLEDAIKIMLDKGLLRDVTQTNVKRYRFTEKLYDFLIKQKVDEDLLPVSPAEKLYGKN